MPNILVGFGSLRTLHQVDKYRKSRPMFVFHFKTFVGQLQIDKPTHDGIPSESPVFVYFIEKEDLTKHEMLRRFNNLLLKSGITWIRPYKHLTNEWIVDLKELKSYFSILSDTKYLTGKISIEPDYIQNEIRDTFTDELQYSETLIKFAIYPDEVFLQRPVTISEYEGELKKPLERFFKDFPDGQKCGFLMMKFEDTPLLKEIVKIIEDQFDKHNLRILRADYKEYDDNLLTNIKTYMHGCAFGVALFDRINSNYFNPNVSLEIGYMMAQGKPLLFLKDSTLISLHTDLVGMLYREFDFQNPAPSLATCIEKWLKDYDII